MFRVPKAARFQAVIVLRKLSIEDRSTWRGVLIGASLALSCCGRLEASSSPGFASDAGVLASADVGVSVSAAESPSGRADARATEPVDASAPADVDSGMDGADPPRLSYTAMQHGSSKGALHASPKTPRPAATRQ